MSPARAGVETRPYDGQAEAVLALYNAATASVPHSLPASLPEMAAWLDSRSDRLDLEHLYVALRPGEVVGMVRYGRGGPDARPETWFTVEPGDGVLATLLVRPGDVEAADALLNHAESALDASACSRIWAFEDELGPPFYNGGFGQISSTMATPLEALTRHGWSAHAGELHLTLDRLGQTAPSRAPRSVRVTTRRLESREWAVEASSPDGALAGQCVWAPMSLRNQHPDARRVGYVWWLGVEEPLRGRGLGRHLMACAFRQMRDNGISSVRLTTGAANYVAQSLYLSLGFRFVDYSLILHKGPLTKKPT
jgi:ribosomal protein S18 acetylase RimI-like enzyme